MNATTKQIEFLNELLVKNGRDPIAPEREHMVTKAAASSMINMLTKMGKAARGLV